MRKEKKIQWFFFGGYVVILPQVTSPNQRQASTKEKVESGWGNRILSVSHLIDAFQQLCCPKCHQGMCYLILLASTHCLSGSMLCTDVYYRAAVVDIELGCPGCGHVLPSNGLAPEDALNHSIHAAVNAGLTYTQSARLFAGLDIQPCSNRKFIDQERDITRVTQSEMEESVNRNIAGTAPKLINFPVTYTMRANQGLSYNNGGYTWIPSVLNRLDHSLSPFATNYFSRAQELQDEAQMYKQSPEYREKKKQWKENKSTRGQQ